MPKFFLLFAFLIFLACSSKRDEEIAKGIFLKESKKGDHLESFKILRSVDTLGILKVYYQAELSLGFHPTELTDSAVFFETGDGILQLQP